MGKHAANCKGILTIVEKDGSPTETHEFNHTQEFLSLIRKDAAMYIAPLMRDTLMDWANIVARDYLNTHSDQPYFHSNETTQYSVTFTY